MHWNQAQAGATKTEISSTVLQFDLDVAEFDPKFSGQLSLHCHDAIGEDVLVRLLQVTRATPKVSV